MTTSASRLLLTCAALAAFFPVLGAGYVSFDDPSVFVRNPVTQELRFHTIRAAFTSYDPELYIPVTLLSFQIEKTIAGGFVPAVTHGVNLALHVVNVLLAFALAQAILRDRRAAFLATLLFAVHPLQTEIVAWGSARKDLLAMCGALLTMLAFLRAWDAPSVERRRWTIIGVATFAFGVLSKVTAVAALPLLALVAWEREGEWKRRIVRLWPLLIVAAIGGGIALFGKAAVVGRLAVREYPLLIAKSIAFSVGHMIVPWRYGVLYPSDASMGLWAPAIIIAGMIVLAAIVLLAWKTHDARVVVGLAWMFVALMLSTVNFEKNGFVFFTTDRYASLALLGFAMIVGLALVTVSSRVATGVTTVIAAVCIPLSILQARTWRDDVSLFTQALLVAPEHPLALNNLGVAIRENGDVDEALALFEQAAAKKPAYVRPLINIADTLRASGNIDETRRAYQRAAEASRTIADPVPDDLEPYAVFGTFLRERGEDDAAVLLLLEAADRGPTSASAQYNAGAILASRGAYEKAEPYFRRAVDLASRSAEARYALASVLLELRRYDEAREELLELQKRWPGYEDTEELLERFVRRE